MSQQGRRSALGLVDAIERPEAPNIERYLTAEELMALVPVSARKLYLMAQSREIRCLHVGRRVLFRASDVIADLERAERLRGLKVVKEEP